jgi:hypothetical protein|tara:strand:- start:2531 stop:2842 length:312 start_codon:yes stop_codon:yes gene_type:complete
MKKECNHEWTFSVPYRPSDSDGIVHVFVEAYCKICEEHRTTDYSWDIDEYHDLAEKGHYEVYECDWCGTEMQGEGHFREEIDDDDIHICSKECYEMMYGGEEE